MKRTAFICILAGILVLISSNNTIAYWENVHERISDEAVEQNINKVNNWVKAYTGLAGVDENINGQTARKWIKDGSISEDEHVSPLVVARYLNHFYDPLTGLGLIDPPFLGTSSYIWASDDGRNAWTWKLARTYLYDGLTKTTKTDRDDALSKSFRAVGQVMHLVQDLASPAHVRIDAHPLGDSYEAYTRSNVSNLNYSLVPFPYWNVSISSGAPKQFWDLDSYNGSVLYSSGYIGLAEYTNANFLSEDTIFKNYPHPAKANTTAKLVEQYAKDGKKDKVWYLQGYTSQRLAAYSYLHRRLLPDKWAYNLDDYVYEDYASQLIPRAVGYSAGLLNYFFRGDIDMVPDDATGEGYVITNNSDEDLKGTFELWYDDKDDQRTKIWSSYLTIGARGQSSNVTFDAPLNPKESCKYIVVFNGKMGSEDKAVIGKIITTGECVQARLATFGGGRVTLVTETSTFSAQMFSGEYPVAIKFDQNDWNNIIVMTYVIKDLPLRQKQIDYFFHKFTFDGQRLNYNGLLQTISGEWTYTVDYVDGVKTMEWPSENCADGGMDTYWDFKTITFSSSKTIVDFFVKGSAVTPLFKHSSTYLEGMAHRVLFLTEKCDTEWDTYWTSITKEDISRKIVYGDRELAQSDSTCSQPAWAWGNCTNMIPPVKTLTPIRIFNERDAAYMENNALKTTLPVEVTDIANIMTRTGSDYSIAGSTKSYSSEIGQVDCGGFMIGKNKIGFSSNDSGGLVKFKSCSDYNVLGFQGKVGASGTKPTSDFIIK